MAYLELLLSVHKDIENRHQGGGLGAVGLSLSSVVDVDTKGLSDALNGNYLD